MPQLPDPTDMGNKPGDGPLRSGGQPGTIRLSTNDLPSTRSKTSKRQQHAVQIMRDLWGGTEAVREAGSTYLPRAPGETSQNYSNRLARSVFFNATRRTIEGLCGLIFRKDPVPGDDVPDQIRDHLENIDNEGTHFDVFCRDLAADALTAGHAAILVEYPKTGGDLTRADEINLNARPYWVPIRKEDIMSWRTIKENGARVLTQLVLRETSMVPDGVFGEKAQTLYRVLYREDGVVGFRLLAITEQNAIAVVDEGTYTTQTEIPVAEIGTNGSESLFDSTPPLLDLGYLNIAHYQQWSDYAFSIHKTNVPFLFGAGIPESKDENGVPIPLVVGANTSVMSSDSQAKMEYVSHDGAALGSSKAALDDLKSDMGTLGLAMLAPQKRAAETAEAKRLDKSTSDSALSVSARALQDGIENALGFHARYMNLETGGSVTINRDFEGLLMDAPVMSAFAQLVQAGFPPMPVLQALQQGGRIEQDADLEELEAEWMMGQALNAALPEPEPEELEAAP
jgi:hypothetical protein